MNNYNFRQLGAIYFKTLENILIKCFMFMWKNGLNIL